MVTLIAAAIIVFFILHIQAKKPVVTKVPTEIGIKAVLISDLHFDWVMVEPAYLIKEICKLQPEIILITGDLCSRLKYFSRVTAFLDMLSYKADCPILITLGNHDHKIFEKGGCSKLQYISELEKISENIHVLENEKFIFKNVLFGGLGDKKTNKDDYTKLTAQWNKIAEDNGYTYVILTHNPDIIINLPELNRLTLFVAGHTHGGQMRVPFNIEFALLKKDILPKKKVYYGSNIYNGKKMYITSGIGCSFLPVRFRSKAEIAYFE